MNASDWLTEPKRIDKPWGFEEIWAHAPERYCGKRITVNAGHRLSLQLHVAKHETMYVVDGAGSIDIGETQESVERLPLTVGDVVQIPAGVVHRLIAADDSKIVVMEASTTELDDVVRLTDDYGREDATAG